MEKEIEKFPAIRDHNGLSVRPDGAGFIVGQNRCRRKDRI
ncbi:MAG: hypothetical protein CM15mP62_33960 [Rhodospirillaceae bacterium]|nr:MAG: hypothetical protein CM15mP62_33960 [Rhodospirillaceae bacterium]